MKKGSDQMKIVAIIQARMGSTRLPGKVLKTVLDKPLLQYQLERVNRSTLIDEIIVATTTKEIDDAIVGLCDELQIKTYRGSEDDVLARYYEAAVENQADIVVRLTSDCPLIDPDVIDDVVQLFFENQPVDYAANTINRKFPRGLDTEVFSFQALERAFKEATLARDREHVTAYLYTNPELFSFVSFENDIDYSHHRWTVDTGEDLELIELILKNIYPVNNQFTMNDIIELLNKNPEWVTINSHIEQKKL